MSTGIEKVEDNRFNFRINQLKKMGFRQSGNSVWLKDRDDSEAPHIVETNFILSSSVDDWMKKMKAIEENNINGTVE